MSAESTGANGRDDVDFQQLLQFERGELARFDTARVERALMASAELRADFEWVAALRRLVRDPGKWPATGTSPATDDEIAALATGALGPEERASVQARIMDTPNGYDLLESALEEVDALMLSGASESDNDSMVDDRIMPHAAPSSTRPPIQWFIAAVAAAALAVFVVRLLPSQPEEELVPIAELAERESLSVPMLRDGELARGLGAYERGDFKTAVEILGQRVEAEPESPVATLYLGSARYLLGDLEGALQALALARKAGADTSFEVEAIWLEVQVLLASGEAVSARRTLGRFLALEPEGQRRVNALALRATLELRKH